MSWGSTRLLSVARLWWVVVLAPVAGALLAYAYGSRIAPVYEGKAILVASSPAGGSSPEAVTAQMPTYAELVSSAPLLQSALDSLRLRISAEELQPNVRGESDASARLITIRVRNKHPAVAAAIANALAGQLVRRVAAEAASAGATSAGAGGARLTVLEPASGASRIRPRLFLNIVYGSLAGLFGGLAVAVLAQSTRRTVRGEDELARLAAPLPVLGSVSGARLPGVRSRILLSDGPETESYRRLSARILSGNGVRAPRSLLVVGAQGNEGSPALAARLGLAVAETLGSVVLAELSRDRPIARLFGIGEESASALARRSSLLRHGSLRLERYVLRAGPPLVLAFPRMREEWSPGPVEAREFLALLLAEADYVFVHANSLGSSPAMLAWAHALDAAVLVVRPARTRHDSVLAAVQALDLARSNVVGTVLHLGRD
jgi:capsular polysaccharide biosynthesis protein